MAFATPRKYGCAELLTSLNTPCREKKNLIRCITLHIDEIYKSVSRDDNTIDNYIMQAHIGSGTFSNVYSANTVGNRLMALKVVPAEFMLLGQREVILLRYLAAKYHADSNLFIQVKDCFCIDGSLFVAMEYFPLTLLTFISPPITQTPVDTKPTELSEAVGIICPKIRRFSGGHRRQDTDLRTFVDDAFLKRFRRLACKLVAALAILKEEKIVHTDIKPENIFIRPAQFWCGRSSIRETDSYAGEEVHAFSRKRKRHLDSSLCASFASLPSDDFEVTLGDFGNSFHISEVSKFYVDFEVQSMPYRSPEVLCGVPFGCQIDVWSLGVVLVELILSRALFCCREREDLFAEMSTVLTPPPLLRFSGGKYTQKLYCPSTACSGGNAESLAECKSAEVFDASSVYHDHIRVIHALMADRFDSSLPCPLDLLHFVGGMLLPDPDVRLSPTDLLTHDFLACDLAVPRLLLLNPARSKQVTRRKYANSLAALRKTSSQSGLS